jgi:hypothetical protein
MKLNRNTRHKVTYNYNLVSKDNSHAFKNIETGSQCSMSRAHIVISLLLDAQLCDRSLSLSSSSSESEM